MLAKKNMLLFTIIILMFGCAQHSNHEIIIDRIINQTDLQLKKEKNLHAIGSGGSMMGDIQLAEIYFQYFHLVNLEEARVLLVYAIQTFLKNINENKEVRPYLHNYPFTTKNIEINIWILQPNGHYPDQGNIELLALENGILKYKLVAPSEFAPWPILKEETYEEALKILAENQ